jgi:hypothetical protein
MSAARPDAPPTVASIRAALYALHVELNRESLLVRSGLKAGGHTERLCERHPLPAQRASIDLLRRRIEAAGKSAGGAADRERLQRLLFACVEAHLHERVAPLGDAAGELLSASVVEVAGEAVPYFGAVPWLERQPSCELRAELARGVERIQAAANPFLLRSVETQDRLLAQLGLGGYLDCCLAKKGLSSKGMDGEALCAAVEGSLRRTRNAYLQRVRAWAEEECGRPLSQLGRFDCIHLLALRRFDPLFPPAALKRLPTLLAQMGLDAGHPHIRLDAARRRGKNPQAVCIGVRIPEEVHLLFRLQGGLSDCESLLHELGHALQLAHADPALPLEFRYLPRSRALSETFAFLLQGLLYSRPFLRALGVPAREVEGLIQARRLKDLVLFRRYGARLLAEMRMLRSGDPRSGGRLYAELMTRHTGFRYGPAGYLTDMDPDLYAADYVLAWMAEARLAEHLEREFGEGWPLDARCGEFLISLWREGERYSLGELLERLGGALATSGCLSAGPLERRLLA